MEDAKTINTLIATATKLDLEGIGSIFVWKLYRGMIRSLIYLIDRTPNFVFSVGWCARFQANPKEPHLQVVKRILHYLKGTTNLGLYYPKRSNFKLVGYVYANYKET